MSLSSDIKILLVEDASVMRQMEKKVLGSLGFKNITEAENGNIAIDYLNSESFDLIISDWNMPEKDGYELLCWVREQDKLKTMPFLMATGRGERKEMSKASDAGVSAFIAKPFNGPELKSKMEEAFGVKKEKAPKRKTPQKTKDGKVKIKVAHIQITDHLVLGVAKHLIEKGEYKPEHFELETECMSSWNPVAQALENNNIDAACVLAPIAMDLFADGVDIRLILFAHKNGSIFVRNKNEEFQEPLSNFFKGKSFYLPHFMSIHHILGHMFFSGIGLKPGMPGKDENDVNFEVVPPVKMPELLQQNPDSSGYLVAEPLGTKAIAAGIAEQQFLSSELWPEHPCCVVTMQKEFINQHPDAVHEFTDLLVKAGKLIDQKPGLAAEIGVNFLDPEKKLGLKVPILKNVLTDPLGITTEDLYPVKTDLDRMQNYMHDKMGIGSIIDLDEFVDLQFAQKACNVSISQKKTVTQINNSTEKTMEILSRGAAKTEELVTKSLLNMEGKYLTFNLNKQQFGIDIMSVREIIMMRQVTVLPQSPEHILGIINLRDRVIPIVDLKMKMGYRETERGSKAAIVIVEVENAGKIVPIGIVVDSVSKVTDISANDIEAPPKFRSESNTEFIMAMVKNDDNISMLLDIAKLIGIKGVIELGAIIQSAA